jgi:hypothetical protein
MTGISWEEVDMENKDNKKKEPIVMTLSQLIAALRQKETSNEIDKTDRIAIPASSDTSFCYFCSSRCQADNKDNNRCRSEFRKLLTLSFRMDNR